MELHTRCICVCVELKCYSGASRSNRGGNELGGGGGWGLLQSGLLCPCKLNFMYVCVCTTVNLYYTFIFMICIHLYLLFSSVCVCVCVCVHLWNEREHPWTNSMWHFRIQPGRELWIFLDRDYYAHVS